MDPTRVIEAFRDVYFSSARLNQTVWVEAALEEIQQYETTEEFMLLNTLDKYLADYRMDSAEASALKKKYYSAYQTNKKAWNSLLTTKPSDWVKWGRSYYVERARDRGAGEITEEDVFLIDTVLRLDSSQIDRSDAVLLHDAQHSSNIQLRQKAAEISRQLGL